LDTGKPGRSTDWKQFRDNQDDHEARLNALEDSSVRIFSHFSTLFADSLYPCTGTTAEEYYPWRLQTINDGATVSRISHALYSGTDLHYLNFNPAGGGADVEMFLYGMTGFYFDTRTAPIICTTRFKINESGWRDRKRPAFLTQPAPQRVASGSSETTQHTGSVGQVATGQRMTIWPSTLSMGSGSSLF
jgi:hypothetical protein